MSNSNDERLIKKYGSWVKVQVAFYDYLFETGSVLCARHFNISMSELIANGQWADGEEYYDAIIGQIENMFPTEEMAWSVFLKKEKL